MLKGQRRKDDFTDAVVTTGVSQHCTDFFFSHLAPAMILQKILACFIFMKLSFNMHINFFNSWQ